MKLHELIKNFADLAKNKIAELALKDLNNNNKKLQLDSYISDYVEKALKGTTVNFVLRFALRQLLLPNVSVITQAIYDLLKARIEGVTK